MLCVCVVDEMDVVFFCLYCEAWSCRCSCMGSVSVSSCRCCMFVSCVHPVAVINAVVCMICSFLMHMSFGPKVRPRTFGCAHMCSALLPIFRTRLLVYSAGSGVNRVHVVCLDLV